eukprot:TRINITY_DN12632_c0_g1_i1.p1 TRINITY_DN12632_c0_g1~~TRINITY_DN12632_c0_g1_i1.p1  ORF type:complete len:581 (-),score=85.84 TRINITY_DN12632_c0_g1_i1:57-1799(-)
MTKSRKAPKSKAAVHTGCADRLQAAINAVQGDGSQQEREHGSSNSTNKRRRLNLSDSLPSSADDPFAASFPPLPLPQEQFLFTVPQLEQYRIAHENCFRANLQVGQFVQLPTPVGITADRTRLPYLNLVCGKLATTDGIGWEEFHFLAYVPGVDIFTVSFGVGEDAVYWCYHITVTDGSTVGDGNIFGDGTTSSGGPDMGDAPPVHPGMPPGPSAPGTFAPGPESGSSGSTSPPGATPATGQQRLAIISACVMPVLRLCEQPDATDCDVDAAFENALQQLHERGVGDFAEELDNAVSIAADEHSLGVSTPTSMEDQPSPVEIHQLCVSETPLEPSEAPSEASDSGLTPPVAHYCEVEAGSVLMLPFFDQPWTYTMTMAPMYGEFLQDPARYECFDTSPVGVVDTLSFVNDGDGSLIVVKLTITLASFFPPGVANVDLIGDTSRPDKSDDEPEDYQPPEPDLGLLIVESRFGDIDDDECDAAAGCCVVPVIQDSEQYALWSTISVTDSNSRRQFTMEEGNGVTILQASRHNVIEASTLAVWALSVVLLEGYAVTRIMYIVQEMTWRYRSALEGWPMPDAHA